jgi:hypothetical protein
MRRGEGVRVLVRGSARSALRAGWRARAAVFVSVGLVFVPLSVGVAQAAESVAAPVIAPEQASSGTIPDPVFSFTAADGATTRCTFSEQGAPAPVPTDCTSPFTGATTGDGTWVLTVQAFTADDTSPVATSSYLRDASATAVVHPLPSPNRDRTPTWLIDLPMGATAHCSVDGAPEAPCAASYTPDPLMDGVHQLVVSVTGTLGGNAHVTSTPYEVDATPPTAPTVTGMPATGSDANGHWTWVQGVDETASCVLVHDGTPLSTAPCTTTTIFSLAQEGSWVLEVTLTDLLGNEGLAGASQVYVRDITPPMTPVLITNPPSFGSDAHPQWVVAGPVDGTLRCTLSSNGVALVTTDSPNDRCTADLGGRPDGSYAMELRTRDDAGNTSPAASNSALYTYDTTAPTVPAVTASRTTGSQRDPSFTFALDPDASATCRTTVPGEALPAPESTSGFTPCSSPLVVNLDAGGSPGTYLLLVRAIDGAGNGSAWGSASYLLDDQPPTVPVIAGPPVGQGAVVFHVDHDANTTITCQINLGAPSPGGYLPCGSDPSYDLTGAPEGTYQFSVLATDEAENTSTATAGYVVDRTPPSLTLTAQPGRYSNAATWTWTWTQEAGSSTSCALVGPGGPVPTGSCGSGTSVDVSGLPDGNYTFQLVATDAAGNARTLIRDSTLDRDAPELTVTSPVSGSGLHATWNITTDGDASTLSCALTLPDSNQTEVSYPHCPTPFVLDVAPDGPQGLYVLSVSVASLAGTRATADAPYLLDTRSPVLTADLGRTPTSESRPTWSIAADEPIATSQPGDCQIVTAPALTGPVPVDAPAVPCTWSNGAIRTLDGSALSFSVDGRYLLLLTARDLSGNVTSASTDAPTASWILDRVPPRVPAVQQQTPSGSTGRATTVTWTFVPPASSSTATTCRLLFGVTSQAAPCADNTFTTPALIQDGRYSLEVTRTDAAGNSSVATFSYALDTQPPAAPRVQQSGAPAGSTRSSGWTFTSGEPDATFSCSLTRPSSDPTDVNGTTLPVAVPCSAGSYGLALASTAPDGTYTVTVAAVDLAGNSSSPVAATYLLDTTPYASPTVTGGPEGVSRESQVEWTFDVVNGARPVCQVRVADGSWSGPVEACSSPYTRNLDRLHGQGTYTFSVWADDEYGNRSAGAASATYRYAQGELLGGLVWQSYPGQSYPAPGAAAGQQGEKQYSQVNAPFVFFGPAGVALTCEVRNGPTPSDIRPTPLQGPVPCPTDGTGRVSLLLDNPTDGAYELTVSADRNGAPTTLARRSFVLDRNAPSAPVVFAGAGAGGTATNTWIWTSDEPQLLAICRLTRTGSGPGPEFACPGTSYTAALSAAGTYEFTVRLVDRAGWSSSSAAVSRYVFSPALPATPLVSLSPNSFGRIGDTALLTWSFPVPSGVETTCVLRRNSAPIVGPQPCPQGAFRFALAGQPPGVYSLLVAFTNAGGTSSSAVDYLLSPAGGGPSAASADGSRSQPTTVGSLPLAPPRPPASTLGMVGTLIPSLPAVLNPDSLPAAVRDLEPRALATVPLLPGQIANSLVPALTQVVGRPALPLALLGVVMVFLLVQNRIDRRDPKLAAAPIVGEPDLTFGPVHRPGDA